MRKDLKIGMIIGVVLAAAATLAISLWPEASIESRQKKAIEQNRLPIPVNNNLDGPAPSSTSSDTNYYSKPEPETPADNPNLPDGAIFHIVEKGQTLGDIAEKYFGNRRMINRIVDSNSEVITDVNKISPGTKLLIELN